MQGRNGKNGGSGETFDTRSDDFMRQHHETRRILRNYNATASDDADGRRALLETLLGGCDPGVWIEPPFYCDYGENIHLGAGVFVNFNCVMLDGDRIEIGEGSLLGPAVQIYATGHPMPRAERIFERDGIPAYRTTAAPVVVGKQVWIGGGAILMPGVSVGEGTTIGAGSVVTKPIPPNVFAAGNPCRVIRDV